MKVLNLQPITRPSNHHALSSPIYPRNNIVITYSSNSNHLNYIQCGLKGQTDIGTRRMEWKTGRPPMNPHVQNLPILCVCGRKDMIIAIYGLLYIHGVCFGPQCNEIMDHIYARFPYLRLFQSVLSFVLVLSTVSRQKAVRLFLSQ